MKKKPWRWTGAIKKTPVLIIVCLLFIGVCAVSLWAVCSRGEMAEDATSATVEFCGEYKIAGGEWKSISDGRHIASTRGDVTLRGKFVLSTPDGEVITDNPEGVTFNLYFNHVSAEISVGGHKHTFDVENAQIGSPACGAMWLAYTFPKGTDGVAEIVISNPHAYGNEAAVDELLGGIKAEPPLLFEKNMTKKYDALRYVGFAFMAMALVLFGVAMVSTVIRLKGAWMLWVIGGWIAFAGGVFVMDAPDVFLWNDHAPFNTAALCLCRMLSVFFLGVFVTGLLSGVNKRISRLAHVALGGVISILALLSAFGVMRIFDTVLYWQIAQAAVIAVLLVCGVREMIGLRPGTRAILGSCLVSLLAVVADFVGVSLAWWSSLIVCKSVFGLMFVVVLSYGIYTVISNHRVSVKSKEMEAELKDKSIAVMISQIQPHFLYNSLNSIAELCVVDPKRAEKATINFSRYLRGNMGALNEKNTIEFEDELNHLNHYIALEKLRYGDDLRFEFDIRASEFTLPALTVQPLVENAVNHGIRYHKMKGRIRISSFEDDKGNYVTIEDDGVGFDPTVTPSDGRTHVGISNVRSRLEIMCGGRLEIESEEGKGTLVTIVIPKER